MKNGKNDTNNMRDEKRGGITRIKIEICGFILKLIRMLVTVIKVLATGI